MHRYQIILHGSGFSVPVKGDTPVIGFLTVRRVTARDEEEAQAVAVEELLGEPKIAAMVEETRASLGQTDTCKVEVEKCQRIGWLRWHLSPLPSRLLIYSEEKEGGVEKSGQEAGSD